MAKKEIMVIYKKTLKAHNAWKIRQHIELEPN